MNIDSDPKLAGPIVPSSPEINLRARRDDGDSEGGFLTWLIAWSIRNRILVLLFTFVALLGGLWALTTTPVDAIPDLSDTQVIVYTEFKGQSPRTVEDQVTYPLTTALVSVPGSRTVRGYSFFGYSLTYVIFEDGVDLYWARSRVLELLNTAQGRLPQGVTPVLGPDGTGVGWVYEYALVSEKRSLQELRSLQDWFMKFNLASVEGVAEVASVGGFVKQYQVQVDPARLRSFGLALPEIEMAIRGANADVGGEVIEMGEAEYMVRGLGYIRGVDDLLKVPVKFDAVSGISVSLGDVANVVVGPEMRRGIAELDGEGEVVGGVVVMRQGSNALEVIKGVKRKLEELKPGLPADVRIVPAYDRSGLILRAAKNLRNKLLEEMLAVALVCALFLFHLRSALVAVFTLPAAVLLAFLVMRIQGVNADIMSLGGIAIAVGAMVDGAIILIENTHKHLEHEAVKPPAERREHWTVVLEAATEVGPALFWSLLVITVSFLPVFTLGAQEGRLFKPLAFTKTYAMAASALLAVTVVPILLGYFVRGGIKPESTNPLNRWLMAAYRPVAELALRHPWKIVVAAVLIVVATVVPFRRLGSEFMPPLYEGELLYMPTTMPGISITKAKELLQQTDKILKSFPEVELVFGKIGRAETATDPAGLDMIETTIRLKPEKDWRPGLTVEKLVAEMDRALRLPGVTNAWTMPIKNRVDMLSTGIKTPVGIKISGANLDTLERIGREVEEVLRRVPGTSSVFAERAVGGNYLDVRIDRERAARYGLNISDVQEFIATALGGMTVSTTVEGLERYPISLRYSRELRDNLPALRRALVPLPGGGSMVAGSGKSGSMIAGSAREGGRFSSPTGEGVPLEEIADIRTVKGPMVVRSEDTRPNSWVFVDLTTSDIGGYVRKARAELGHALILPAGYSYSFSGQFEYMQRANRRLLLVIPLTLLIIVILLYLNTKSLARTALVMAAVPFSLVGAIWILHLLGYNLSLATWLGMIALAGLDAETGVVMLLYLDRAVDSFRASGRLGSVADLKDAIRFGAVQRVRPKIMTASVILAGLVPILWSHGAGSDVMKRIAAPMVGGVVTSVLLELAVYPAIYLLWQRKKVVHLSN